MPRRKFNLFRFARSFRRDENGVAAIEFGYVAPILLLMLLGTVEVCRAIAIERRFGQVTAMIADLVAREETLTAADITAMYAIVETVMAPYDAKGLKISIVPVKSNPVNPAQTVVYAKTTNRPSYNGAAAPSYCSAYPVATNLLSAGGSMIVVQAEYAYVPSFTGYLFSVATWQDTAFVSPRNSCVDFDANNCVSTCF